MAGVCTDGRRLPKTAVVGASGFLGRAFLNRYRKIYSECIGTFYTLNALQGPNDFRLDLRSPNIHPLKLAARGHRQALILASVSKLMECERKKAYSRKINVDGTLELIRQLHLEGIRPVFPSSDIVFDGNKGNYRDEDPTSPVNEYGRQKAEIESRIGEICRGDHLVIRLSKTFSLIRGDKTLLDEMAGRLAQGRTLEEASDLIFCPVLISDVLHTVEILQAKDVTGTVNICGSEAWSRFEIATALARAMSRPLGQIRKVSIDDLDLGCQRPKNISMQNRKMVEMTGVEPLSIMECICWVGNDWKRRS